MRVLVLDDKILLVKDIIRDVKKVLPDAECIGFHKEMEALAYAREHTVDVALLDIDMPNMDGITVAKHLRKFMPRLNIIFLTGYPEYALESYKVLASDFLVKPVSRTELKRAFEHLRYPVKEKTSHAPKNKYEITKLGERIKQHRTEQGMTAEMLAKKLDVSFQTVYRWESGERIPDTTKLISIANAFGIGLDELIFQEDKNT